MLGGPVLGYFIGTWLDELFGTSPYLLIVLLIFGLVASFRETIKLVKQLAQVTDDDDDSDRT
jgi:F0F1-type ATP synthase assembly protein I